MESVLTLYHARDKIFSQLSSIEDLISLGQVSQSTHRWVSSYSYTAKIICIYLSTSGYWCLGTTTHNPPSLPSGIRIQSAGWQKGQPLLVGKSSEIFQRGPALANVYIRFNAKFSLIGWQFDSQYFLSLLDFLSAQIRSLRLSIDLNQDLPNKMASKQLPPQSPQSPPPPLPLNDKNQSFTKCRELFIGFDQSDKRPGYGRFWQNLFWNLIGSSDGGFLSRFPSLQKLTIAGTHGLPLDEIPNPKILQEFNLELTQQEFFKLSANNLRPCKVLDLAGLKTLRITTQYVQTYYYNAKSFDDQVWEQTFGNLIGVDLLTSLSTTSGTGGESGGSLEHLTLDLSIISSRWAAKLLASQNNGLKSLELLNSVAKFSEYLLADFSVAGGWSQNLKNLRLTHCSAAQVHNLLSHFDFGSLENLQIFTVNSRFGPQYIPPSERQRWQISKKKFPKLNQFSMIGQRIGAWTIIYDSLM